jgi:hypothetical protein
VTDLRRQSTLRVLVGLLPLWVFLFLAIALPGFMDPVFANPPAVAGLPGGVVLIGAALVVMAIGVEVLRRAPSTTSTALALAFLTVPSLVVVVMAPALILMIQNVAA